MKEDSIIGHFFNLLFKVIAFFAYCFTKIGEIIFRSISNWLNNFIKKP